jgi:hypothetical protein
MKLEKAIHQRWADDATLNALLPAERVTTGLSCRGQRPYATLSREAPARAVMHANSGEIVDEVALRIDIWSDEFSQGRAIAEQVRSAFDRAAFDLDGGDRVVQMRRDGESSSQDDDAAWKFSLTFTVFVHLPTGI